MLLIVELIVLYNAYTDAPLNVHRVDVQLYQEEVGGLRDKLAKEKKTR